MEESLSLLGAIRKKFVCDRVDIRTYSPLTLAFVGDCIYDLVIRTIVVERGNTAPIGDYRKATGLEALYGFLYLTDQTDRLLWLIAKGLELTGQQI